MSNRYNKKRARLKELKEVKKEYNELFMQMLIIAESGEYLNEPELYRLLKKEENRLNRKEVYLQSKLGLLVPDPCTNLEKGQGRCWDCYKYETCTVRENLTERKKNNGRIQT